MSPEAIKGPEQFSLPPEARAVPEQGVFENSAERFEQRSEGASSNAAPVVLPQVIVNNTTQPTDTSSQGTVASSNPTAAKDSDSIEKEWISRIKQVLKDTKDDPYKKEEEVKDLKADYLDKRYGRKIGSES